MIRNDGTRDVRLHLAIASLCRGGGARHRAWPAGLSHRGSPLDGRGGAMTGFMVVAADLLKGALHEAGHAVTAYRLRVPIERVIIDSDGQGAAILDTWGIESHHFDGARRLADAWFGPMRTRNMVAILIAGHAAQSLQGETHDPSGCDDDFLEAVDLICRLVGEEANTAKFEEIAKWAYSMFVDDRWRLAVVDLAAVLLKRHAVARYTVKKVSRAADADPNPGRWVDRLEQLKRTIAVQL